MTRAPWKPFSKGAMARAFLFAIYCAYFAHTGQNWVHLFDSANLAFHEAGHPIFGIALGSAFTVYGGTLGQLVFPAVSICIFWLRRESISFVVGWIWFTENLWNIARYMADARAQELPLVGSGDHDWTEILSRWGVLHLDQQLSNRLRVIGWVILILALAWLEWRWRGIRRESLSRENEAELVP